MSDDRTPLQLVEETVLEQAKAIRLDLGDDDAKARLRGLVDDAVASWTARSKPCSPTTTCGKS